jgi:ATP-binding cassette, subfamily B, bacterial HlyB/CyaB
VLFAYSVILTLIVLISIPVYLAIAIAIRPILREKINQRFNTGAASQQFLVEAIVGIHTLKSAAIEPILRNQWEERLAAYVKTSFQAVKLSSLGQNLIQYVSKATTALVLFFGALAVMNGEMTVGGLVAFNMIMAQVMAPILRLSQLWQDFQQVQVSVERLGDILNAAPETARLEHANLPPARGAIRFKGVTFRYKADGPATLTDIDLDIPAGQTLGIAGQSGSGKSTLAKLMQRLYRPERGTGRRHRHRPGGRGLAAPPDRRGAPGEHPVQPHHPREHRAGRARHEPRAGHRDRAPCRRRRVHRQAAARL